MRLQSKIMLALYLLLSISMQYGGSFSAVPSVVQKRIRFNILTVEEKAGGRSVISEAVIEGPQGTDFNIQLQSERFKMDAGFLTDLSDNSLKVRAKLNTRRLYGYSERELPLYEEDLQRQSMSLGFDEGIVLLPFGRKGGSDRLKIEISPVLLDQTSNLSAEEAMTPQIKIIKPGPGRAINIQAFKVPHLFDVEAALLENGVEIARNRGKFFLEEKQQLLLQPKEQAASNMLAVDMAIEGYTQNRAMSLITINFDLYRMDKQQSDRREAVALKWAGAGIPGSELVYDLEKNYLPQSDKKYELKFKIRPALD